MRKILIMFAIWGLAAAGEAGLIDDFESYTSGNALSYENGAWFSKGAADNQTVATDGTGNQYYAVNNVSTFWTRGATIDLGVDAIADGSVANLAFRLLDTTGRSDTSVGLCQLPAYESFDDEWGSYGPYVSVFNGQLRVRNAANTGNDEVFAMTTGTWYDILMVVDNDNDMYDLYVDGSLIAADSPFRVNPSGTLQSLKVHMQHSNAGDILGIDDISVTVVPEPASLVLLGLGGLLVRKRK